MPRGGSKKGSHHRPGGKPKGQSSTHKRPAHKAAHARPAHTKK